MSPGVMLAGARPRVSTSDLFAHWRLYRAPPCSHAFGTQSFARSELSDPDGAGSPSALALTVRPPLLASLKYYVISFANIMTGAESERYDPGDKDWNGSRFGGRLLSAVL